MGASSTKSVQWSRTLDPHLSLTESSEHSAVCLQNEDPAWRCGTGSDLGGTGEQVRAASCIQVWHYTVGTGTQPHALLHGTCLLVLQLDTTVILCSQLEH